jgi:hypothetical protein
MDLFYLQILFIQNDAEKQFRTGRTVLKALGHKVVVKEPELLDPPHVDLLSAVVCFQFDNPHPLLYHSIAAAIRQTDCDVSGMAKQML